MRVNDLPDQSGVASSRFELKLRETTALGCYTGFFLKKEGNKRIKIKSHHFFTTDHTHTQSPDLGFTIYFSRRQPIL